MAERADKAQQQRRPRKLGWRRVPSRVVLFTAFLVGVAGFVLAVFPFEKADGDRTLNCGPPLYEVVVPADEAFDVPENAGCPAPAKQRLLLSGALIFAVFVVATLTQVRARRLTALSHQRWLEGPRRRPTRRERRAAADDRERDRPADRARGDGESSRRALTRSG